MNQDEWDRVKARVYFPNATHDDRFTWAEIDPAAYRPKDFEADGINHATVREGESVVWADLVPRYRITGCAHKHRDADGRCTLCGDRQ